MTVVAGLVQPSAWGSLLTAPDPTPTATTTPTPPPSGGTSAVTDNAASLPGWLLVTLLVLVVVIILAMFALSAYSLSAPRSTLKNVLGQGKLRTPPPEGLVTPRLVSDLATSARGGRRTTRTTLAVGGFSLLGVVVVAIFGLSGEGVRDLRAQVVASVTTLIAAIAGFYFGAQTASGSAPASPAPPSAPRLGPDPQNPHFKVGQAGSYHPALTGNPAPTVSLAAGSTLPAGLTLSATTGAISGTPTSAPGQYSVTLSASNGVAPAATLPVTLVVDP